VLDSIEDVGRRDWTRTNDPHHVKVVNRTLLNFFESSSSLKPYKYWLLLFNKIYTCFNTFSILATLHGEN